jgi:hypothetical protein
VTLDSSVLRCASREKGTRYFDYRLCRNWLPFIGFALLPLECLHHCFYRIAVGHVLSSPLAPALQGDARIPATPSARSVNSCAASRCQRLEFKRLEIVDMLRITSFKARASGAQRQCPGRERPLTAARAGTRCARRRGILRQAGSPNAHQRRYRGCAGLSRSSPPPSPAARRSPTWWVAAAKVEPSAPRLLRLFQPTRL